MTTQANLLQLGYNKVQTYMLAALFVVGNLLLPQLCHLLPYGGSMWLPIYFFTLVAAYKYGWKTGLLVALFSPLLNHLLFGMPAASVLPAILVKSVLLAGIAAFVARRSGRVTLPLVLSVILGYQVLGTLGEWILSGSLAVAVHSFRLGLPGMAVQLFGGWVVLKYILKS